MGIATAKRNIGNKATKITYMPLCPMPFLFLFWAFFQSVSYFDNNFFQKGNKKQTKSTKIKIVKQKANLSTPVLKTF